MFTNCKNIKEVKQHFFNLTSKARSEGKDTKAIFTEYVKALEAFKTKPEKFDSGKEYKGNTEKTTDELNGGFAEDLQELFKIPDIIIKAAGSWLWIEGETKAHRAELKAIKCRWSPNKKCWYWHNPNESTRFFRGKKTLEEIYSKYGVEEIEKE